MKLHIANGIITIGFPGRPTKINQLLPQEGWFMNRHYYYYYKVAWLTNVKTKKMNLEVTHAFLKECWVITNVSFHSLITIYFVHITKIQEMLPNS